MNNWFLSPGRLARLFTKKWPWIRTGQIRRLFLLHILSTSIPNLVLVGMGQHMASQEMGSHYGTYLFASVLIGLSMSSSFAALLKFKEAEKMLISKGLAIQAGGYALLGLGIITHQIWLYYLSQIGAFGATISLQARGFLLRRHGKQYGDKLSSLSLLCITLLNGLLSSLALLAPLIIWVLVTIAVLVLCLWVSRSITLPKPTPQDSTKASNKQKQEHTKTPPWWKNQQFWLFAGMFGPALFNNAWILILPQSGLMTDVQAGIILGVTSTARAFLSYLQTSLIVKHPSWSSWIILINRLCLLVGFSILLLLGWGAWGIMAAILIGASGNDPVNNIAHAKAANKALGHSYAAINKHAAGVITTLVLITWVAERYGYDIALRCLLIPASVALIVACFRRLHKLPEPEEVPYEEEKTEKTTEHAPKRRSYIVVVVGIVLWTLHRRRRQQ